MRPRRLLLFFLLATFPLLLSDAPPGGAQQAFEPVPSALAPASTGGIATVERALAKLSTDRRVLVVGAHPDDEDTSLLALVSRAMGGEAAYLSLSRGEGGQNLIGDDLGVALGLLRTQELLAARRVDGARQFFSRAYDFGYTRSLEETLGFWPEDALLKDVVRIIRRFRPQVLVSVFPGDGRGGHGQHQAAGAVAHRAYRVAGDATAYPELAREEGLAPWSPQVLYREAWFAPTEATLVLPTGAIDPVSGKSIYQVAMASRSQHRSQDMGRLQEIGPHETRLTWEAGGGGAQGNGLFAGIDTHLAAIAAELPQGDLRRRVEGRLGRVEELARSAGEGLEVAHPEATVPAFRSVIEELSAALAALHAAGAPAAAQPVAQLVEEKLDVAEDGLAAAAGIVVDAVADEAEVVSGRTLEVTASLWNAGSLPVSLAANGVRSTSAAGWTSSSPASAPAAVAPGALASWKLQVSPPPAASPTVPYFLERPLDGYLYDWSAAPPAVRGLPFQPPPVVVELTLQVGGQGPPITLERQAVARFRDQAEGEIRRPLRAVPRLEVAVAPNLLVWPLGSAAPRTLSVELVSHAAAPLAGDLRLEAPTGWSAPPARPFTIATPGGREESTFTVREPAAPAAGRYRLTVVAEVGGTQFSSAVPTLDYPHVPPMPRPAPATVEVSTFPLTLPPLHRVGYVRGAADRVPEFLREVGLPIELLDHDALTSGDLDRFDVVVVGSRAYEVDPALRAANDRLLDYVRRGGLVIVQYQQYPFVEGGFSPFPLTIARPHDRITDETAPVEILAPESPVFRRPNAIDASDWRGWVQERGLYFAHTWDPAFTPLLAMRDPDQPEQRGGLLVAHLGEGTYVYTGIAFFRQLPAGVPGAYRLFANLLGLAHFAAGGGAPGAGE